MHDEATKLFFQFQQFWKAGTDAFLNMECHGGHVQINLQVKLPHPSLHQQQRPHHQARQHGGPGPSRLRRRARRAEARAKAAAMNVAPSIPVTEEVLVQTNIDASDIAVRDELCPDGQYEVAVAEQADGHSQSQHQHAAQPQYQQEVLPQHQREVLPQRQHADHPPRIPQLDGFIDQQQCMLTLNSFSRAEERKKEREDDMENFKRMMQSKFGF